jgi:hypothetical protein
MNSIKTTFKSAYPPMTHPLLRVVSPLFQGETNMASKAKMLNTLNGKPRFSGSQDTLKTNTHTLGRLDTFI